MKDGSVGQLKRVTGEKYRDAVMACLRREFDFFWQEREEDRETLLHLYLKQVQDKVVDPISACSA